MRFLPHWFALVMSLLVLTGVIGFDLYSAHEAVGFKEREQLTHQTRVINDNLSMRLQTTNRTLEMIRADLPDLLRSQAGMSALNQRLQIVASALPGVGSIQVVNADGVAIASNLNETIGLNFRDSDRYQTISKGADPATLYISAPFVNRRGIYAISLAKAVLDGRGNFGGFILVIVDPEYFRVLLSSVLYESDVRSQLIHGDGKIVFRVPDTGTLTGMDLGAAPNSMFNIYMKGGQRTTAFEAVTAFGENRLVVYDAIKPASIHADKPLLISVSRDVAAIYAPWRRRLETETALLAMLASIAMAGLFFYQRRQMAFARLRTAQAQQKEVAEQKIRQATQSLQLAIDGAQLGTWHWDVKTNQMMWSDACLALLGLAPGSAMSRDQFKAILHPQDRQRVEQAISRSVETKADYNEDYRVIGPDGSERWINAIGRPFCSADGKLERMEGIVQDISLRRAMEEQIREHNVELERKVEERTAELGQAMAELDRLARHDVLTGLSNRLAANERLHTEFVGMKRSHSAYAVLMLDIDFFKRVNDTHGHAVGDQVLQKVAQTMKKTLRESDFAARFGGEEFLALLPATNMAAALQVAEKLRQAVEASPDPVAGRMTVSIGLALANPEQANEDAAVRAADDALYRAKREGRNQIQIAPESLEPVEAGDTIPAKLVQLVWRSGYESGNLAIDAQHRALFGQANKLLVAATGDRPSLELLPLVDSFVTEVARHFQDEEAIITAAGYPDATAHAALHRALIEKATELVGRVRAGSVSATDLFEFLARDLVTRHILTADRQFFSYIQVQQ